jgi:hypothetical protein
MTLATGVGVRRTLALDRGDLLVEMEPRRPLLDFAGSWQELEELLGTSVDLLSDGRR